MSRRTERFVIAVMVTATMLAIWFRCGASEDRYASSPAQAFSVLPSRTADETLKKPVSAAGSAKASPPMGLPVLVYGVRRDDRNEYETQITNLNKQATESSQRIRDLEAALREERARGETFGADVAAAVRESKAMSSKLSEMEGQLAAAQNAVTSSAARIRELESLLNTERAAGDSLRGEVLAVHDELNQAKTDLAAAKKEQAASQMPISWQRAAANREADTKRLYREAASRISERITRVPPMHSDISPAPGYYGTTGGLIPRHSEATSRVVGISYYERTHIETRTFARSSNLPVRGRPVSHPVPPMWFMGNNTRGTPYAPDFSVPRYSIPTPYPR